MRQRSVVSSFIYTSSDPTFRVAIFKRSPDVSTYRGKWAVCSGSIDSTDESPESAARREIAEETTLGDSDIAMVRRGKPFSIVDEGLQTEWEIHPFAFQLRTDAKKIELDWEHTEYRFIRPDELKDYDTVPQLERGLSRVLLGPEAETGLRALKDDLHSDANELAMIALETLLKIVRGESLKSSMTAEQLWSVLRVAAWHLAKNGQPSVGAVIEAAVCGTLDAARVTLGMSDMRKVELPVLKTTVERAIEERMAAQIQNLDKLATVFQGFVTDAEHRRNGDRTSSTTSLVALPTSSSIAKCLSRLIQSLVMNDRNVELSVLEPRPCCKGVAFTTALLDSLDDGPSNISSALQINISSNANIATMVRAANYVVIGAHRVSPDGDVSSRTGSLAAAALAKILRPDCIVLAVFETDKIAGTGDSSEHPAVDCNSNNEFLESWPSGYGVAVEKQQKKGYQIKVINSILECVPAAYIDHYVSDEGLLTAEDIKKLGNENKDLVDRVFGDL